jgi:Tol biopolymer transport system component
MVKLVGNPGVSSSRTVSPRQFASLISGRNSATRGIVRRLMFWLCAVALLLVSHPTHAQAPPCNDPNPSRPILFVHGILEGSPDWAILRESVISKLQSTPGYSNQQNYDLYFNGTTVKWSQGNPANDPDANGNIPCDARFFSIRFFSWNQPAGADAFDPMLVANVSIISKAFELSQVVSSITEASYVKNVIVVAHSMGALDTRAYIEGLGSKAEYNPCIVTPCFGSGTLPYEDDIAHMVTVDGANSGAELAAVLIDIDATSLPNAKELEPDSDLVKGVNYKDSYNLFNANLLPSDLSIDAIISSYRGVNVNCLLSPTLSCSSDNVVLTDSQSIQDAVLNQPQVALDDIPTSFDPTDFTITGNKSSCYYKGTILMLHLLPCVGDTHPSQQTSTGQPTTTANLVFSSISAHVSGQLTQITVRAFQPNGQEYLGAISLSLGEPGGITMPISSVPYLASGPHAAPGCYLLSYNSGGPSAAGHVISIAVPVDSDCKPGFTAIQPGNWSVEFVVNFTAMPASAPVVTTLPVTQVAGDGGRLEGTVNPNNAAVTSWFEWGTNSNLASFNSTAAQALGVGASAQTLSFPLSGLESNTTYYFRVAASNGTTTVRGSPLSFKTSGTLPKPTLQSPSSTAIDVSNTPSFTWTAVTNASSYRIIIATSPGALPNDPNVGACGFGCVLNDTPTGASYSPAAGILASGTTYYWEVHARGASQYGDWSTAFSFTTGTTASSDFALSVAPTSQSATQTTSVTYAVSTTITSGAAQNVTFSVGDLPVGTTASFDPPVLTSGNSTILTISTASTTSPGSYTLSIIALGSSTSHSTTASVTVVSPATGSPLLTASPSNSTFPSQTVNAASAPLIISLVNSGGAALTITSLTPPAEFYPSFLNGLGLPITLPPGAFANMQVVFIPTVTGLQQGNLELFNTTNASPLVIPLAGTGQSAPVTTGNIQVNATFNGQPWTGTVAYTLSGPQSHNGGSAPFTYYNSEAGSYTLTYSIGGPGGATFNGITPSLTQNLSAGQTITFTLNFMGPNIFSVGDPQPNSAVLAAGNSVQVQMPQICIVDGSTQIVTLTAAGIPPGASATFSPNPVIAGCGPSEVMTVSTAISTPPGIYPIVITGTNQDGLSSASPPVILTVDLPPATRMVSIPFSGTQGDGVSGALLSSQNFVASAVSADGRYVAFVSSADNLVPGDTNGQPDVFVRDMQTGTITLVSVATDGTQADNLSTAPSISADGRYVAFVSAADNLYPGSVSNRDGIYVHDMQGGTTARIDVASDGTPANLGSLYPSLDGDGRFVAFESSASNLISSAASGGIFVFNRMTGIMRLASVASDGTPGNGGSLTPRISDDGRYIAFVSSSTNLVPGDTNGATDAFVHDFESQQTTRVNVANDGTQDDCEVFGLNGISISADGRYVQFVSCGTTLVQGLNPGGLTVAYVHDMNTGRTSPLSVEATGDPFGAVSVGTASADGRFVTFGGPNIYLEDQTTGSVTLIDVASDGSSGNGTSGTPSISADGGTIVFSSASTNLVSNDANGFTDVFSVANPFLSGAVLNSLTLTSSSAPGGGIVTGAVTLNGPAPAGGATVVITSNNSAASVPPALLIPAGASTGTFSFNTTVVSQETLLTLIASYNGGSSAAVLTLEPAPLIEVSPGSSDFGDQAIGVTSSANAFTISNAGTAQLSLNSVALMSGQVFTISSNTCAGTIPAGSSCSVTAAFKPATAGLASDSLQISYGNPANLVSVSLLGTGAAPSVVLSPSVLSFGNENVSGSTAATITVTNVGNAALTSILASINGINGTDFKITSVGCKGASIAPNNSCLITMTFAPKAPGSRNATLSLMDNASNSPQTVALTGVGTPPVFSLSPTTLVFGGQPVGITSSVQIVTAQNNGTVSISVTSISVMGSNATDFAEINNCGSAIAPGASCTISVTFTPLGTGNRSAAVTLSDSSGAQKITLSGTGAVVELNPATLSFGVQSVGTSSAPQSVNITNVGSVTLSLTGIAVTGTNKTSFAETNTCGGSIAAGTNCVITVLFKPSAVGPQSAFVTVTDAAGAQTLSLSGSGLALLTVSPRTLSFGNQALGSVSTAKTITVTNNTGSLATLAPIVFTGTNASDFVQSSTTCGPTLAWKSSCTESITFTPGTTGARSATLVITNETDPSNSVNVTLSGSGIPPVSVSPTSLVFAAQSVGTTSASKAVSIKNNLPTALVLLGITTGGQNPSDFQQTATTCGTSLAAGATCTVSISFTAGAKGSRAATLSITDSAITSPQVVNLSGTGK